MSKRLLDLEQLNEKQLSTMKQSITQDLADKSNQLVTSFAEADQALLTTVTSDTDAKIAGLKTELVELNSATASNIDKNILVIKDIASQELNTAIQVVNKKISDTAENFDTKLIDTIDELSTSFTDQLLEEQEQLETRFINIDKTISTTAEALLTDTQTTIEALKLETKTTTDNLSAQHDRDIEAVTTNIAEVNKKLTEDILRLESNTAKNITELVDNITADYTNKIGIIRKESQEDISACRTKHTTELASLRNSLQDTIRQLNDLHETNLTTLTDQVTADAVQIRSTLEELKQNSALLKKELVDNLTSVQDSIKLLNDQDTSLLSKFYSINNTLSDVSNTLSEEISTLRQTQVNDLATLTNKLNALEELNSTTSASLLNTIQTYVTNIYAEIYDLIDDDVSIIKRVFAIQNTLSDRLDAIEQVKDSIFTENQLAIEALRDKVQEDLDRLYNLVNNLNNLITDLQIYREYTVQKFVDINNQFSILDVRLSQAESDINAVKDITIDTKLRVDIDMLAEKINNAQNGLATTYALAQGASTLAYSNTLRVAELLEATTNCVHFNEDSLQASDDIIIFSCGKAVDSIDITNLS